VSSVWKEFINYHTSEEFWLQICSIFEDLIPKNISDVLGPPASWKLGVRGENSHVDRDLLLDAQISGNTPVLKMSSVRGSHLDKGNKLFAGLLYLRDSEDTSSGGDLKIQRWSKLAVGNSRKIFYHENMRYLARDVAQIPYSHNVLVLFLNTPDSLHAVTPRSVTPYTRKFVNLVGELEEDIFAVQTDNLASSLWRRLGQLGQNS
jgi:hypothetical protein